MVGVEEVVFPRAFEIRGELSVGQVRLRLAVDKPPQHAADSRLLVDAKNVRHVATGRTKEPFRADYRSPRNGHFRDLLASPGGVFRRNGT